MTEKLNNTTVIILIGAPGSGKSTFGKKFALNNDYIYLSSDENRARIGNGEDDQAASGGAFALLRLEMEQALNNNRNVVVDACFTSIKARHDYVKLAKDKGAHLKAISFELPREVILERNAKRAKSGGRNVPTFVIDRMLGNYQAPTIGEFDEVQFIRE